MNESRWGQGSLLRDGRKTSRSLKVRPPRRKKEKTGGKGGEGEKEERKERKGKFMGDEKVVV